MTPEVRSRLRIFIRTHAHILYILRYWIKIVVTAFLDAKPFKYTPVNITLFRHEYKDIDTLHE